MRLIWNKERLREGRRGIQSDADHAAGGGNTLGLSMSRQIAEAHNGTLTMTSTPGEGAIFTLRLPIGG
jgi:signal transduction histidine kinase